MPQYLKIAEKIYSKLEVENKFSTDPQELLDLIFLQLRKELKDTGLKLRCHDVDVEDCFKTCTDRKINLDISIIPHHKHKDEYKLWWQVWLRMSLKVRLKENQGILLI